MEWLPINFKTVMRGQGARTLTQPAFWPATVRYHQQTTLGEEVHVMFLILGSC